MGRYHHIALIASLALLAPACDQIFPQNLPQTDQADSRSGRFPALTGRVVDQAGVLSEAEERLLSDRSAALEKATGHQLVVVTVPDLRGEDVAAYTRDLGRHWGIGRKHINDGVVILVAPNDRRARIAIGYGLESRLPNDLCARIMDDRMMPYFRRAEFALGLNDGMDVIIAQLIAPSGFRNATPAA